MCSKNKSIFPDFCAPKRSVPPPKCSHGSYFPKRLLRFRKRLRFSSSRLFRVAALGGFFPAKKAFSSPLLPFLPNDVTCGPFNWVKDERETNCAYPIDWVRVLALLLFLGPILTLIRN
ncbi:hypothetical protein TNIN_149171 [Trichonephila inaurata madagascariensis]|uniref:Uncharacterized protein n=1 Tax=Trichonephila inaurata madagascariensis TaxID=2747483 RepID=A0A8X6X704_9ARAC|nr:hypothetical protein TNIN_149171 [Trichonephila inaurata madagascariensis]